MNEGSKTSDLWPQRPVARWKETGDTGMENFTTTLGLKKTEDETRNQRCDQKERRKWKA
jgi:hypothetical protein